MWSPGDRIVDMMQPHDHPDATSRLSPDKPTPGYQDQEFQQLELAFLGSLVPGIIHNLATPLSGVLGATQLLEKRAAGISELLEGSRGLGEAERGELLKQLERNRANVDILARNARHLADILQTLVQRINRGGSGLAECHSLNELLQNELRFLEANLQFKHRVKKQLKLGSDVRTVKFAYGHVASAIDEFVCSSLATHDFQAGLLDMEFRTEPTETHMALWVEVRGASAVPTEEESVTLNAYLEILRADGWKADVVRGESARRLRLLCPRPTAPA